MRTIIVEADRQVPRLTIHVVSEPAGRFRACLMTDRGDVVEAVGDTEYGAATLAETRFRITHPARIAEA